MSGTPHPRPHDGALPSLCQSQRHSWLRLSTARLSTLAGEQYLTDPRRLIADFYRKGNRLGPAGSMTAERPVEPATSEEASSWFAVYRPCSRDSISKMLGQVGVGKGLNIKGKSAKKNKLSGPMLGAVASTVRSTAVGVNAVGGR